MAGEIIVDRRTTMNPQKEEKKNTFTKSIMSIIVLLYFLGAVIGTVLVVSAALVDVHYRQMIDTAMFIAYAAYIGGPTATAIGFYAWKSKAENILKIKNSNELHQQKIECNNLIETLANMRGE